MHATRCSGSTVLNSSCQTPILQGLPKHLIVLLNLLLVGCASPPPSPPATGVPSPAASHVGTPRVVRMSSEGRTFLELHDEPGQLVDGNAPPPLKPLPTHPFLRGSCFGGRPLLCSQAKAAIDKSRSFDETVKRLQDEGFVLEP